MILIALKLKPDPAYHTMRETKVWQVDDMPVATVNPPPGKPWAGKLWQIRTGAVSSSSKVEFPRATGNPVVGVPGRWANDVTTGRARSWCRGFNLKFGEHSAGSAKTETRIRQQVTGAVQEHSRRAPRIVDIDLQNSFEVDHRLLLNLSTRRLNGGQRWRKWLCSDIGKRQTSENAERASQGSPLSLLLSNILTARNWQGALERQDLCMWDTYGWL